MLVAILLANAAANHSESSAQSASLTAGCELQREPYRRVRAARDALGLARGADVLPFGFPPAPTVFSELVATREIGDFLDKNDLSSGRIMIGLAMMQSDQIRCDGLASLR